MTKSVRWVCTPHTRTLPGIEVFVRANKGLFTPTTSRLFTLRLLLHSQENEDRGGGNPIVFYQAARVLLTQIEMIFTACQCGQLLRRAALPKARRDRRSSNYKLAKDSGFWKKIQIETFTESFFKSSIDIWHARLHIIKVYYWICMRYIWIHEIVVTILTNTSIAPMFTLCPSIISSCPHQPLGIHWLTFFNNKLI